MVTLVFYFVLVLVVSFVCSILESVLLSSNNTYIEKLEMEKRKGIKEIRKWKLQIDKALSSILALNTIANTVGAAGVGAQVIVLFGDAYFGLGSAILTICILFFSEIIPKSIGAKYWKALIIPAGKVISVAVILMYPLVILTKQITKLFPSKDGEQTVSKEEFSVLANIGHKEGVFDETQNKIIQNILKLKDVKVKDIMTPRTVLIAASQNSSIKEFLESPDSIPFSRIPIYSNDLDHIEGYVLRYDLIENYNEGKGNSLLKEFKRELNAIYEHSNVIEAWLSLLNKKEHVAIVVSEYGGVEGLVSLEDIIETIVGLEIVDERDKSTDMREKAKERWEQKKGKYNLLSIKKEESIGT